MTSTSRDWEDKLSKLTEPDHKQNRNLTASFLYHGVVQKIPLNSTTGKSLAQKLTHSSVQYVTLEFPCPSGMLEEEQGQPADSH
jgi:hypothetical protein